MQRHNRFERLLLKARIAVLLLAAKTMVGVLPFAHLRRSMGLDRPDNASTASADQIEHAILIGRYVREAVRRLPFGAVCLPQAMTARWVLKSSGIHSRIELGARKGTKGKEFDLHAWLMVGSTCITGQKERAQFQQFRSGKT